MIILQNNKIIKKEDKKTEVLKTLIYNLFEQVEIKQPFTLQNLFNILKGDLHIYSLLFSKQLGKHDLFKFYNSIKKKGNPSKEIKSLEVGTWFEIEEDNSIFQYYDFGGIAKKKKDGFYGLDMINLATIKNLPLKIKNSANIYNVDMDTIATYETKMTVHEFLGAIFDEISFYGTPEESQKKLNEIKQIASDTLEQFPKISKKIKKVY
jgi:hypothetical protein